MCGIIICHLYNILTPFRSYGLHVHHFNELSHSLSKQTEARKKVLLQAYLYKITADLEGNLRTNLPLLPPLSSLASLRVREGGTPLSQEDKLRSNLTVKRYAQVLREIENCRLHMRDKIKVST
ncbi:hypothetical protein EON65_45800 [archaeon]|nr:MAG: hypothetical protein EON65_45800 [archaeon]